MLREMDPKYYPITIVRPLSDVRWEAYVWADMESIAWASSRTNSSIAIAIRGLDPPFQWTGGVRTLTQLATCRLELRV